MIYQKVPAKMIKNKTKNSVLVENKKILSSVLSRAKGLMFSKKILDIGYIFKFSKPKKIDLHMFFVFYAIDVLFLDDNKRVIEIKENFKPFTIYVSKNKASYVIELPQGTIKKSKTKLDDTISF